MGNKNEKLPVIMQYDEAQTIPLAVHEMHMARNDKRLRYVCIGWAVSIIVIVSAFVWLWNQYDYASSTEYKGVYNLVDSEGNVISSDISPEDVVRILEELDHGNSQENQNQN